MRRHWISFVVVTALAWIVSNLHPLVQAQADAEPLCTICYPVADLSVWRRESRDEIRFDPSILIAHIRAVVGEKQWSDRTAIEPFEKNASLVISQTQANHEAIVDLLQGLRPTHAGEEDQRL